MKVLVGGQKVKLESQNSDKKSKYWKGSQSTAQSFLCNRVFGSWAAFYWGMNMILYAVQLKRGCRKGWQSTCIVRNSKYFTCIQKCMDFTFYPSDFQTETHFYVCPGQIHPSWQPYTSSESDMAHTDGEKAVNVCLWLCVCFPICHFVLIWLASS